MGLLKVVLIFGMLAIAAEVAGFEGIVIVICPLKSLNIGYSGETVQQHAPSSVADNPMWLKVSITRRLAPELDKKTPS